MGIDITKNEGIVAGEDGGESGLVACGAAETDVYNRCL